MGCWSVSFTGGLVPPRLGSMPLKGVMNDPIINPRRACVTSVTVVVLYVCVCVCLCPFSLFFLFVLLGIQREVSPATAWKMKMPFSLNCSVQKLEAL